MIVPIRYSGVLKILGSDGAGKVVYLATSPVLAAVMPGEYFGAYVLLYAIWSVAILAQFGGADLGLGMHAADPNETRAGVFAGCTRIATIAFPIAWSATAAAVLILRPAEALGLAEYILFLAGLLPASYAAWQIYLLRFGRKSAEFARATIALKTIAPALALAAAVAWPVGSERLGAFYLALALGSAGAAVYATRLRRDALPLPPSSEIAHVKVRQYFLTGATLLPGSLAYASIWASDRVFTNAYFGAVATGIVGVGALLGSTVLLIVTWLNLVWDPIVVEWSGSGGTGKALTAKVQLVVDYACIGFFAAAALGVVWGPLAVTYLFPADLRSAIDLLPWYFAAAATAGVSGIASATILIARAPRTNFVIDFAALAICGLTVLIAPRFIGLQAFPAAILVAEVFRLGTWIYLGTVRYKNLPLNWWRPMTHITVLVGIAAASLALHEHGLLVSVVCTAAIAAFVLVKVFKAPTWRHHSPIP